MNDLSEKCRPNTLNLFETGMSKQKGTKEANMRAYGPDVSRFAEESTNKQTIFLYAHKCLTRKIQYNSWTREVFVKHLEQCESQG